MMIGQGFGSWARRGWDGATLGVNRRKIEAAEAAGDGERLADWTTRREQVRQQRHQRWMDTPKLAVGLALVAAGALVALVVGVGLVGLLVQVSGAGRFLGVLAGVRDAIGWMFSAVPVVGLVGLLAGPPLLLAAAWREGRRRGRLPGWLATAAEADLDVTIDETTIAAALAALRIPQISEHFKRGLQLQYLTTARKDGRGTHAVIRLPAGVTAEKIARRRADLATGLHRLAKEVWPTTGGEAGILDLWIADKGALAEGAGPYPLLDDGLVDVFKGVPFGKTLRGEPIVAPLMERNTICGGMPGQGKSAAARVIMCGAALDPTAELRIWVPDSNFDFEVFRPRLARYVMGAENERIAEILEHLRELHAEVQARGELLVRYETPAVTRELASRNVGLHPLFCLLEEAHVAIQHPVHGAEIAQLLVDIVRLGRKRAIHVIVSTQAPTKDSMPRDVTRNCSNGIAFAVGDHVANDALLGQGAYAGGHRATELIPGTDRGTAVVKGFSGARSEMVQSYFLDVDRTNDQVSPIIARGLAAIGDRGLSIPGAQSVARQIESARDLLEDLDAVLGAEAVPTADVPALLARLAPQWAPYRALSGKALRDQLAALGVKVASTGNRWPLDPVTVRTALARRATADLDDDS
jgi:S-DNA-T family DNA segregation ATPase FtsK/SpoIIIE